MDFLDKKVLFMGDSITSLGGWVARFNEIIKPKSFVNIAVSGARWQDCENTVYSIEEIYDDHNTMCNQLERLLRGKDEGHELYKRVPEYDSFDIIIIAAGTNDWGVKGLFEDRETALRSQFYTENNEVLPLKRVDRKTWGGAMRVVYEELRRLYPNADIFYCTPIQGVQAIRPYETIKAKGEYMKEICSRLSDVTVIDTFHCGICGMYEKYHENGRDLVDGLHPNANGEIKIAKYNARAIKNFYS